MLVDTKWLLAPLLAVGLIAGAAPAFADHHKEGEKAEKAEAASDEHAHEGEAHDGDAHDHEHADEHHGAEGEHAESGPDPLATDPDLAIWTLIVFFLLLAVLSQLAWKPIMEGLQKREEGITGKLADAQKMHEEAKTMIAEHQAKLAGAAEEVRELLAEAHRDAETTVAQAKADAKAEFEAERDRATRDIEQATDAAVRQLAEKSATLAIDLAGRVVKQDLSADRQSEIVREALGRFSGGPSAN